MHYITYDDRNCDRWKQSLVECYKKVFAAAPWNEDWWTDQKVLEVLERYGDENARIILAVSDDNVVGFSWGAVWTGKELIDELGLELPLEGGLSVAYIKDIGVTENYRQQGVAKSLLEKLVATFRKSCDDSDLICARTLGPPEPSVVYGWFPKLGMHQIAEYGVTSERSGQVILGCILKQMQL